MIDEPPLAAATPPGWKGCHERGLLSEPPDATVGECLNPAPPSRRRPNGIRMLVTDDTTGLVSQGMHGHVLSSS